MFRKFQALLYNYTHTKYEFIYNYDLVCLLISVVCSSSEFEDFMLTGNGVSRNVQVYRASKDRMIKKARENLAERGYYAQIDTSFDKDGI